jgi:hypothetical protein
MAFPPVLDPSGLLNQVEGFKETLGQELAQLPPQRASALHLAFLADSTLHQYNVPRDKELAIEALHQDPCCIDAHRVLATPFPTSSVLQDLRELLFAIRPSPPHHPHIRILMQLGVAGFLAGDLPLATHALEEVIRVERAHISAADLLVLCYLKIIGANRQGSEVSIVRTFDQLDSLCKFMNRRNRHSALMDVLRRYSENDDGWRIAAETLELPSMNESELDPVGQVLVSWPDFVIDYNLAKRIVNISLINQLHPEVTRLAERSARAKTAVTIMERAVASFEEGKPEQSIVDLGTALRLFREAGKPSERFSANVPIAYIVSLVHISDQLRWYLNLRNWIRIGLVNSPDRLEFYDVLPKTAEFFGFDSHVVEELKTIARTAKRTKDATKWRGLARRAVAVSSLKALMLSANGELTEDRIEWLMKVGVEDLYTSVNQPVSALPLLPWLSDGDLEVV